MSSELCFLVLKRAARLQSALRSPYRMTGGTHHGLSWPAIIIMWAARTTAKVMPQHLTVPARFRSCSVRTPPHTQVPDLALTIGVAMTSWAGT